MKNVFFRPWVGKYYFEKGYNGKRIIVLGDSHYCKDEIDEDECYNMCEVLNKAECKNMTNRVINIYFDYKKGLEKHKDWMNTYTKFVNIFQGLKISNEELLNFWDSVIFYNYIQRGMPGPRIAPTNEMYEKSKLAFYEVLNEYKPDLIIVWGERLGNSIKTNANYLGEPIINNNRSRFYYYTIGEKSIPAFVVSHPSTSYFDSEYTAILQEVLRLS